MDKTKVIELLESDIKRAGSQMSWATRKNISFGYVNDVLRGKRDPGWKILEALDLEKVVTYRAKKP